MYKKCKTFRKQGFDQENSLNISKKNKNRNIIHDLSKSPVEHKGFIWLSPMNKAFISSKT